MGTGGSKHPNVGVNENQISAWKKKYHLTDEQVNKYLAIFAAQRNKDNMIMEKDFEAAMVHVGVDLALAKQMFVVADMDRSGTIDIVEFMMLFGIIGGGSVEQKLEASFKLFDADSSGFLTPAEIGRLFIMAERGKLQMAENAKHDSGSGKRIELPKKRVNAIKDMVKEIFKKVDVNHDGQISLAEFKAGFARYPDLCVCHAILNKSKCTKCKGEI